MAPVPIQPVATGPNHNADFGASFRCQIVCVASVRLRERKTERVCDGGDRSREYEVKCSGAVCVQFGLFVGE